MPYEVKIKDQKTGNEIRREIESLKELKELLQKYHDQLIDFEMKKIKKKQ